MYIISNCIFREGCVNIGKQFSAKTVNAVLGLGFLANTELKYSLVTISFSIPFAYLY